MLFKVSVRISQSFSVILRHYEIKAPSKAIAQRDAIQKARKEYGQYQHYQIFSIHEVTYEQKETLSSSKNGEAL